MPCLLDDRPRTFDRRQDRQRLRYRIIYSDTYAAQFRKHMVHHVSEHIPAMQVHERLFPAARDFPVFDDIKRHSRHYGKHFVRPLERKASGNELVVLLHEVSCKQGGHHVQSFRILGDPGCLKVEKRLRRGKLYIALRITEHYHRKRLRIFQLRIHRNDRFRLFYLCLHHGSCHKKSCKQ